MGTQSIKMSQWEKSHYRNILDSSSESKDVVEAAENHYSMAEELQTDVFASLYKGSAALVPEDEIRESHRLNWSIMANALESPEYRSLHVRTKRDQEASLLASCMMAQDIILNKVDADTLKEFSELQELENQLSFYEGAASLGDKGAKDKVKEIKEQIYATRGNIDLDGAQVGILSAVNDIAKSINKKIDEIDAAAAGFDLNEGKGAKMSAKERFALARQISNRYNLNQISDWLGRLRRVARSAKKTEFVPEEIVTVATGNELTQVLPSEFAYLSTGMSDLFYQKYAERQLLQFDKRKPDNIAQGPFIIAIDTSGSMRGAKDHFAKGLALALMEIGRKEKRDVWVIVFSGPHQAEEFYLPHNDYNPNIAVAIAEKFYNGGTDFNAPVDASSHIMRNKDKKADLIFLSDGDGRISQNCVDDFHDVKNKLGSRALGIVIGRTAANMSKFCDKVISNASLGMDLAKEVYEWAVM